MDSVNLVRLLLEDDLEGFFSKHDLMSGHTKVGASVWMPEDAGAMRRHGLNKNYALIGDASLILNALDVTSYETLMANAQNSAYDSVGVLILSDEKMRRRLSFADQQTDSFQMVPAAPLSLLLEVMHADGFVDNVIAAFKDAVDNSYNVQVVFKIRDLSSSRE